MIATQDQQAHAAKIGAEILARARRQAEQFLPPGIEPEVYWTNVGHMMLSMIFVAAQVDETVDRSFLIMGLGVAIGQFMSQHSDQAGASEDTVAALQTGIQRGFVWDQAERAPKGHA